MNLILRVFAESKQPRLRNRGSNTISQILNVVEAFVARARPSQRGEQ
jgi:hypothetical protein